MKQFCKNCGRPLNSGVRFCPSCGAGTGAYPSAAAVQQTAAAATQPAAADPLSVAGSIPGPLEFIKLNIGPALDSLKNYLKDPKQLLPMLVLAVIWLVLSLLPALDINPWPVRLLSFLTFAQAGMYGGVWGALGGIIGKAVFAYFISVLILPLFMGKNPFAKMSFKGFLSGLALQGLGAAAELMLGLGLALIIFNFFTGNADTVNSMAGIVGFVLALKAFWSKGGFFRGLVFSLANKLTRGRIPSQITVSRVIAGYAAGSALGIALSFIPLPYLAYILGALLFIAGLVISATTKPGKAVPVA